jgi:transposase InsO family protein
MNPLVYRRKSKDTMVCADRGVQRHLSAPYTPQHNGVVERRNQTVAATACSMLKGRGVPNTFWGDRRQ